MSKQFYMDPVDLIIMLLLIGIISGISGLVLIIRGVLKKKASAIYVGILLLIIPCAVAWLLNELSKVSWKVGG